MLNFLPTRKHWFYSLEEANIFSFTATRLACKNNGEGGITRLRAGDVS